MPSRLLAPRSPTRQSAAASTGCSRRLSGLPPVARSRRHVGRILMPRGFRAHIGAASAVSTANRQPMRDAAPGFEILIHRAIYFASPVYALVMRGIRPQQKHVVRPLPVDTVCTQRSRS
jgi:hypothetical protein